MDVSWPRLVMLVWLPNKTVHAAIWSPEIGFIACIVFVVIMVSWCVLCVLWYQLVAYVPLKLHSSTGVTSSTYGRVSEGAGGRLLCCGNMVLQASCGTSNGHAKIPETTESRTSKSSIVTVVTKLKRSSNTMHSFSSYVSEIRWCTVIKVWPHADTHALTRYAERNKDFANFGRNRVYFKPLGLKIFRRYPKEG